MRRVRCKHCKAKLLRNTDVCARCGRDDDPADTDDRVVEHGTAVPGEKRSTRRPK